MSDALHVFPEFYETAQIIHTMQQTLSGLTDTNGITDLSLNLNCISNCKIILWNTVQILFKQDCT